MDRFSLEDFRGQLLQMQKLGSMRDVLKMIPGLEGLWQRLGDTDPDREMRVAQGIINSMTPAERRDPDGIEESRCCRIARGSGCVPADVERFIRDFLSMRRMMEQFASMPLHQKIKYVRRPREHDPDDGTGSSPHWRWN